MSTEHSPTTMTKPVTTVLYTICRSSEDVGQPIDTVLEPGLQLMQQHLTLEGRQLTLVVPRDVDAVLDMYIDRGDPCKRTAH